MQPRGGSSGWAGEKTSKPNNRAPLPSPLPALRWRGEGEVSRASGKVRPELFARGVVYR